MTATVPPVHEPGGTAEAGADFTKAPRTLMPISVNLLPDEVVRARTAASARRTTAIALLAVAALMGAWYFQAREATSSAQDRVDQVTQQTARATHGQLKYTDLTKTKNDIQTIGNQLKQVTKGDVSWAALIGRVRAQLRTGITLSGITSTASVSEQASTSNAPGTMVLTGNAPSETGVHDFADRLAALSELSNTFVTSVTAGTDKAGVTFSISVVVNKDALNSRYAKAGTR